MNYKLLNSWPWGRRPCTWTLNPQVSTNRHRNATCDFYRVCFQVESQRCPLLAPIPCQRLTVMRQRLIVCVKLLLLIILCTYVTPDTHRHCFTSVMSRSSRKCISNKQSIRGLYMFDYFSPPRDSLSHFCQCFFLLVLRLQVFFVLLLVFRSCCLDSWRHLFLYS